MNKIAITPQSGLILEGGGMRGVFTSGVLDCFMDWKRKTKLYPNTKRK